jgi:hypothetical protein
MDALAILAEWKSAWTFAGDNWAPVLAAPLLVCSADDFVSASCRNDLSTISNDTFVDAKISLTKAEGSDTDDLDLGLSQDDQEPDVADPPQPVTPDGNKAVNSAVNTVSVHISKDTCMAGLARPSVAAPSSAFMSASWLSTTIFTAGGFVTASALSSKQSMTAASSSATSGFSSGVSLGVGTAKTNRSSTASRAAASLIKHRKHFGGLKPSVSFAVPAKLKAPDVPCNSSASVAPRVAVGCSTVSNAEHADSDPDSDDFSLGSDSDSESVCQKPASKTVTGHGEQSLLAEVLTRMHALGTGKIPKGEDEPDALSNILCWLAANHQDPVIGTKLSISESAVYRRPSAFHQLLALATTNDFKYDLARIRRGGASAALMDSPTCPCASMAFTAGSSVAGSGCGDYSRWLPPSHRPDDLIIRSWDAQDVTREKIEKAARDIEGLSAMDVDMSLLVPQSAMAAAAATARERAMALQDKRNGEEGGIETDKNGTKDDDEDSPAFAALMTSLSSKKLSAAVKSKPSAAGAKATDKKAAKTGAFTKNSSADDADVATMVEAVRISGMDEVRLKTFEIKHLKAFLKANGLPVSGNKGQLIERILGHAGKTTANGVSNASNTTMVGQGMKTKNTGMKVATASSTISRETGQGEHPTAPIHGEASLPHSVSITREVHELQVNDAASSASSFSLGSDSNSDLGFDIASDSANEFPMTHVNKKPRLVFEMSKT